MTFSTIITGSPTIQAFNPNYTPGGKTSAVMT